MSRPSNPGPRHYACSLANHPDIWPGDTYESYYGNVYLMSGDGHMRVTFVPSTTQAFCAHDPSPWLSFGIER
jgi:hypothetical protein